MTSWDIIVSHIGYDMGGVMRGSPTHLAIRVTLLMVTKGFRFMVTKDYRIVVTADLY